MVPRYFLEKCHRLIASSAFVGLICYQVSIVFRPIQVLLGQSLFEIGQGFVILSVFRVLTNVMGHFNCRLKSLDLVSIGHTYQVSVLEVEVTGYFKVELYQLFQVFAHVIVVACLLRNLSQKYQFVMLLQFLPLHF